MHYYQKNIADYRKDTSHLSLLEHGIYNQLIDSYYLDEKPIKTQLVVRRLSIKTQEEKIALENILCDFFIKENDDDCWVHKRIDLEICKYKAKAEVSKVNGSKGGRPAKHKITQRVNLANPELTKGKANQEPLTNNHKPLTINQLKDNNKDLFDLFWMNSSKRGDKKKAYSYFNKILNKKDSPQEFTDFLINDIKQRKAYGQLGFDQMHITTYLNGERFEDEIQIGESNGPNRFTKPGKETALERMARKQKAMDARAEASGHYEAVLGQNDSVISSQVYDH
jgi:uncharacterized protein YdaU (DUF1376 family)